MEFQEMMIMPIKGTGGNVVCNDTELFSALRKKVLVHLKVKLAVCISLIVYCALEFVIFVVVIVFEK